jgi:type IV secretion system protein TrbI
MASKDPVASPKAITSLRPELPSVMRISRKSVMIGSCALLAVIGGAFAYALNTKVEAPRIELLATTNRPTAATLDTAPKDYSQIPKLGPPLPGDLGRPIFRAQQENAAAGLPVTNESAIRQINPADGALQLALQERDAARISRLFLGASANTTMPALTETPQSPAALPENGEAAATSLSAKLTGNALTPSDHVGKRAFLSGAVDRRTTVSDRLSAPLDPNIVQAGSLISAALITGIRSDIPGQITAQVTQNVYDSPTGQILLIPQGARLIGDYDAEISVGQSRVLLAWNRLIMPDGRSVLLDRQPGADAAGFAGLEDGADYHVSGLAKAALISTILGIGAELGSGSDDRLTRALQNGTQDSINQAGQQVVQKQLSVAPTLTIRAGFPVRVIVTKDLILEAIRPLRSAR